MNFGMHELRDGASPDTVRQFFATAEPTTASRWERPRRRNRWARISRMPRRRLWWVCAVAVGLVVVVLLVATRPLVRPDVSQDFVVAAPSSESPLAAAGIATRPAVWQGTVLPVTENVPTRMTARRAIGFSRDALGAAIAATHLSIRIDPTTGPRVFQPLLRQQTQGNSTGWLRRIQQSYRELAAMAGVQPGRPVSLATGHVLGWRSWLETGNSRDARVDLLVATPQAERKIFRVELSWQRGDWRLVLPDLRSRELFSVKSAREGDSFTPFFVPGDQG